MSFRRVSRHLSSFSAGILGSVLVFLSACSQTKDTFINRTCHNLSAHYNGYYNAGLKVEEGKEKLAEAHNDIYDRVLRVFPYANAEKAKQVYPQMDDAIKRTSTVIAKHTMYDRRGNEKPASEHWIDDNWNLYGQALFFKHEYFQAMEAFRYVEATYKTEPGRYVASMWIAKTYLELTQLDEAEGKLDYLRNTPDFPKKERWMLAATNADFYVQVRNYERASIYLKSAAELAPKRDDRIRFLFILAQISQQSGDYQTAFATYSRVIKMNPKYEMGFNARINRARCFDATSGSSEEVKKELEMLEKDPKNLEFLDQIYYAQAGLARKEGRLEDEIIYLNKSVQASTTNKNQKALSYLELGKIHYEKPDYRLSSMYYDSVVTNLSNDYPDYSQIVQRRNSLTKLVRYLNTIAKEDSLQQLAKLDPAQQALAAEAELKKREEQAKQERERKEMEQSVNQIFGGDRNVQQSLPAGGGSSWYFYNTQAMSFGFNEFVKKWGNRKLEDNWRRSNKEILAPIVEESQGEDTSATGVKEGEARISPEEQKQELLKNIPSTPEALEKSTAKIIDAYYNAGMLYREQLGDLKSSVAMFEEMLQKHPKNKYELQTYYQLYRMCEKLGNATKADYYKNLILNQFPKSDYAEIIRNPNYLTEMATRKSDLELFYEETYRKYLNGEYASVIQRRAQAAQQFPDNKFMPQFDLLRALSIGRTQPVPQFEASLQEVAQKYPDNPVHDEAQNILDYLSTSGGKLPAVPPVNEKVPAVKDTLNKRSFNYMPDTVHYVVVIFQAIGGALDGTKLKNRIADFNSTNYSNKGLTLQEFMFDHRYKIFVIRQLPNKGDAVSYNSHLFDNDDVYGNISSDNYKQFAISANNLPELLKQKKTEEYEVFFRAFYQ